MNRRFRAAIFLVAAFLGLATIARQLRRPEALPVRTLEPQLLEPQLTEPEKQMTKAPDAMPIRLLRSHAGGKRAVKEPLRKYRSNPDTHVRGDRLPAEALGAKCGNPLLVKDPLRSAKFFALCPGVSQSGLDPLDDQTAKEEYAATSQTSKQRDNLASGFITA